MWRCCVTKVCIYKDLYGKNVFGFITGYEDISFDDEITLHPCLDVSSVISFIRAIKSLLGELWLFEFPPLVLGTPSALVSIHN